MIYQLYQKQVEAWKERFIGNVALDLLKPSNAKEHISSRHKEEKVFREATYEETLMAVKASTGEPMMGGELYETNATPPKEEKSDYEQILDRNIEAIRENQRLASKMPYSPPSQAGWEERFDKRFELESEGCSECGGFELIDNTEIRYPKGNYHCEYDLNKIKSFISQELKAERQRTIEEVREKVNNLVFVSDTSERNRLRQEGWVGATKEILSLLQELEDR